MAVRIEIKRLTSDIQSPLKVTALVAVRIEITWAPSARLHGEVTALVAVRIEIASLTF